MTVDSGKNLSFAGFFDTPEWREFQRQISARIDQHSKTMLGARRDNFGSDSEFVFHQEECRVRLEELLWVRDALPEALTRTETGVHPPLEAAEDMYGEDETSHLHGSDSYSDEDAPSEPAPTA